MAKTVVVDVELLPSFADSRVVYTTNATIVKCVAVFVSAILVLT